MGQLCRMLDGLPLALELAAARVPLLGVNGLVEQLAGTDPAGARLQLLTSGMRTAAPHQRTLRATLDWSHALLTPAQQRVFRRLSVFCGGFTLPAAQALCTDDALDGWAVLDALDALQEKSLLTVTTPAAGSSAAAPAARFGQLESVREYAREQLRQGRRAGCHLPAPSAGDVRLLAASQRGRAHRAGAALDRRAHARDRQPAQCLALGQRCERDRQQPGTAG
ncbi:MAG: hypothetical protein IPO58_15575 [Betaproteobacteria bacterium]|nr:hypothetical protein [Betaproteobacteria bacterium]